MMGPKQVSYRPLPKDFLFEQAIARSEEGYHAEIPDSDQVDSFESPSKTLNVAYSGEMQELWRQSFKIFNTQGKSQAENRIGNSILGALASTGIGFFTMGGCSDSPRDEISIEDGKGSQFNKLAEGAYSGPLISIREVLKNHTEYLYDIVSILEPYSSLRVADNQGFISKEVHGEEMFITMVLPIDDDKNPENGRILLVDNFIIDLKSLTLKSVERHWQVAPEVQGPRESAEAEVGRLNEEPGPSVKSAERFIIPVLYDGYFSLLRLWARSKR